MFQIPRAPLLLGLAGLLPFFAGAVIVILTNSEHSLKSDPLIIPRDGLEILRNYGTIILAFMSGVLWGFATKAEGAKATTGYVLSVIPALWAFFMLSGDLDPYMFASLIFGFIGLLVLDYFFYSEGLAPPWWMRLRILLTSIVVCCLAVGVFA